MRLGVTNETSTPSRRKVRHPLHLAQTNAPPLNNREPLACKSTERLPRRMAVRLTAIKLRGGLGPR